MDSVKIQYYIIAEDDTQVLADLVERFLREGWKLQGGVAARTMSDGSPRFYQAMIRESEEKSA